jgi:hypothetical protein
MHSATTLVYEDMPASPLIFLPLKEFSDKINFLHHQNVILQHLAHLN